MRRQNIHLRLVPARFEVERFAELRLELVRLDAVDFFAPVRLLALFFVVDLFLVVDFFAVRPPLFLDAVFFLRGFSGMSAPERRASLNPMAIACLGFLTLPPRPLFNS
jgi:hypothetical protein